MKKRFPISNASFRTVREKDWYYVDKSLLIRDFLESERTVTLITRPRRFGKTLNMSMLAEFFDITKDSKAIFEGLAIMDTEYADKINTMPVIYLSFKDCAGTNVSTLKSAISRTLYNEYERYYNILSDHPNKSSGKYQRFILVYKMAIKNNVTWGLLPSGITILQDIVHEYFKKEPILLIDEYDQPIISSHEHKYHDKIKDFFSSFYGSAMKEQPNLSQALLTGIQRVAKESIFSKLNNISVYTVLSKKYASYFGFNAEETKTLLEYYDLELNDEVKGMYDGYSFGGIDMYNPWSILNYADARELSPYWVNTSNNSLTKQAIMNADSRFVEQFHQLIEYGSVEVGVQLETSFMELQDNYTLWGLLLNAGYITIQKDIDELVKRICIPNGEVRSEFKLLVAEQARIDGRDLNNMFRYLMSMDLDNFMKTYRDIVLSCTSYHDAKEERKETASYEAALHMLFLGMCISLKGAYKVTSNMESGHGRSDIIMESFDPGRCHVVIEFKQGEDIDRLKEEALNQIMEKEYYAGLRGKVLCVGLAHDKKKCEMAHRVIEV